MANTWDKIIKMLVGSHPQDFVSLLLPEARFEEVIDKELYARTIEADVLFRVTWEGQSVILHAEFQRYNDNTIGRRMWEYNAATSIQTQLSTSSFVLYLVPDGNVPEGVYYKLLPNGRAVHVFYYDIVKLWEMPVEELEQPGREGMLPLMPLTKGGMSRERVSEMIQLLQKTGREDLYAIAYSLAALTFQKTEDKQWLRKRFDMLKDILEESWAYQEMVESATKKGMEKGMQEGMEKGMQEGMEKGMQEGIREGIQEGIEKGILSMREAILHVVRRKYPQLETLATRYVNQMGSMEQLGILIDKLVDVHTSEEATQLFTQKS